MIRIVFIFALLLASGWAGIQLSQDPGYVIIGFKHWTVETTLWFAIFALLFMVAFIYFLLGFIKRVIHIPARFRKWRQKCREHKAQEITRKGFIEYSEGYWSKAQKHLLKAVPDSDTPLLNYLTAARAAQKMGDHQLRDQFLREAQKTTPEAKIAVELTQAELQISNQQWEQALATLRHLSDLAPNHPYVLKLLAELYQQVRDWPQLVEMLPLLKKHKVFDEKKYVKFREMVYTQALAELVKTDRHQAIEAFIQALPKDLIYQKKLNLIYVDYLLEQHHDALAESRLRRLIKKNPDEQFIERYGHCRHQSKEQLAFAESLLKKSGRTTALMLCLGRLSYESKLWGKAQQYFESAIDISNSPEAYSEMGRLYEQLNEPAKAREMYKSGLRAANLFP